MGAGTVLEWPPDSISTTLRERERDHKVLSKGSKIHLGDLTVTLTFAPRWNSPCKAREPTSMLLWQADLFTPESFPEMTDMVLQAVFMSQPACLDPYFSEKEPSQSSF